VTASVTWPTCNVTSTARACPTLNANVADFRLAEAGASTSSSYCPGFNWKKSALPSVSVTDSALTFVSISVRVSLPFATIAPDGSTTLTTRSPEIVWADARGHAQHQELNESYSSRH